jgi:RNA recognition motif-containing protein
MTILIRNLPIDVINEDLKDFFTEYGKVNSAQIIRDKFTGFSRGFGFVEMPNEEAAKRAIKELNRGKIDGQEIIVMEAKPREERVKRRTQQVSQRQ